MQVGVRVSTPCTVCRALLAAAWALWLCGCEQETPTAAEPVAGAVAIREETTVAAPALRSANHRRAPIAFTEHIDDALASFQHDCGFAGEYRLQEIMGSGAALFDFDGDGLLDIYLVNGDRERAARDNPARGDRLLRQREDGTFEDVTAQSGIRPHGFGMGVAVADYDNDRDLDLLLTGVGQLQLFRNEGDGTFVDVSASAGIADQPWCVGAAFADFDRDGWLDLIVVNYLQPDARRRCFDALGRREYCGPQHYQPLADVLYHNEGGTFRDVSRESGIGSKPGPGLGVVCVDFNNDGRLDIYVANDAAANFLWLNHGDGTFTERATPLGCAYNREGAPEASMGVTVGDVNGDGDLELFMTHLFGETNTMYRRLRDGSFMDITPTTGLGPPSLPFTGFGDAMFDADLDGDLDIVVVNGGIRRRQKPFAGAVGNENLYDYAEPCHLYLNNGSGRFDVYEGAEFGIPAIEVSRGLAVGDVNRDGALDLLTTTAGGGARLWLGELPRGRRWLEVRAFDALHGRDALGALVIVRADGREFRRHLLTSYSYACSNEAAAHFGLGAAREVDEILVQWPDGAVERYPGVRADSRVTVLRGDGENISK